MATPENQDTIVVTAFSARFIRAFEELLDIEGGFVDDPVDRGGATKFGISLRFLASEGAFDEDGDGIADFDLDMDGDIDGIDIRKLTLGDVRYLYDRFFWKPVKADSYPYPIGEVLFDQAVNGGIGAARKLLQQAINACMAEVGEPRIVVDGVIGPQTETMLEYVLLHRRMGTAGLLSAYREAVRDRYRAIVARYPSQKRFLRGWLARAEKLGRS